MYRDLGSERTHDLSSEPKRRAFLEWEWDTQQHHLMIDEERCRQLLNSDLPTLTGNVLLPCMSYRDQTELLRLLTEACHSLSARRFGCCLQLSDDQCCYIELSFKGINRHCVKGVITPLLFVHATTSTLGALFEQLFNNPHHGVLIADQDRKIVVCNDYFLKHANYTNQKLAGCSMDVLNSSKHSDNFYPKIWQTIESVGSWSGVVLLQTSAGKTYPQDLTLQKVTLVEGVFYVGVYLDLSDNLYRIADVELGGVELLTQLPTEKQFIHTLANQWMDDVNARVSMVVAFHPIFDQVDDFELKSVLSEHLASNQVVEHVGYLGSDHFVACLECDKVNGPSQIRLIHRTIRRFFAELNHTAGSHIHNAIIKGRVGVSVLGHDTHSPKLLVSHAVQAMLEQSVEQRGQITFYHGALHKEVLRRKELEEWAEKLIKAQAVEVYYQPIVDVKSWDIVKFEALSRFKAPNGQLLNTQEMVMIAEDLDLVSDLDWCVGKKALQDLNSIQEEFGRMIGVTINRSLNTKLEVDEVLQSADSLVHQYASTPENVTIELTESAYFDSESRQSSLIRNIRHRGVKVAIDDFGTGYSSFSYLSDCNFDILKIDREFIKDLKEGSHKFFIVKMITQLAHTLDVKVVAEGVETAQELGIVCGLGVDYIQGYFFSKPLPMEELGNAWNYCDKLERFLSSSSHLKRSGILSITKLHLPTLTPGDTIEKARILFESDQYSLEEIPIVDRSVCVGIVSREDLNLHLSPTLGTKLETARDVTLGKKTLNQVMNTHVHTIPLEMPISEINELIKSGVKPPWLVVNERGGYLGIITSRDILQYFADG
ncbi:EAL domain-containing protein [Vibrio sp. RE86]|uniref:EAL domain-containing protein n=1 Tax=Vibrio sp. RE86 TaxID=2607605 RepID=UPI001493685B|nr:EAL domain-containing protein [Vibrio sp. RE86]NOH80494.1 EAL domain-containing protein [Vibrio sp. RE86]